MVPRVFKIVGGALSFQNPSWWNQLPVSVSAFNAVTKNFILCINF